MPRPGELDRVKSPLSELMRERILAMPIPSCCSTPPVSKPDLVIPVVEPDQAVDADQRHRGLGCARVLDAVVYQLADDPIENHLDVGIETLGMQIGRKMNLHAAVRQPADKIGHGASQSEVFQNMRAQIDRNLAQTADGLVDYVAGVSQNLAAALVGLIGRQRRNGHLGRREQRPQPVVQILRETQPLFSSVRNTVFSMRRSLIRRWFSVLAM